MGGFFLCPRSPDEHLDTVEQKYRRSLEIFEKKKLELSHRLVRDEFIAYRFRKRVGELEKAHVLEKDNGDFVVAVGAPIVDGEMGGAALDRLYDTFAAGEPLESRLSGNFGLIIWCDSELWVLTDFCGYYPIYGDPSKAVLSNSLLAVARSVGPQEPSAHEFYEFLLHGHFVARETLLPDVRSLDSRKAWRILPSVKATSRNPHHEPLAINEPFPTMVERVAGELMGHFGTLARVFGTNIGSALSGGYDTRLVLALLRQAGSLPYLYVYGKPESTDVRIALRIAEGEGIRVDHVDKSAFPQLDPEAFAARVESDVIFFDGLNALGGINDGVDLDTRFQRAERGWLQLNGAGGEIYREIWNLSDRNTDLVRFLRMRYDKGRYPYCRSAFQPREYFARFADKMKHVLGIERSWVNRSEAEMLYPFLRLRFAADNNAANNQISYSIQPFVETSFIFPSFDIPIRYKYCGRFQAEILRRVDPALARYPSAYGINFYDPIPAAYRFRRLAERHIPFWLRMAKRRRSAGHPVTFPYFLEKRYLEQVFDLKDLRIAEFVDVGRIEDPEMLSRALSAEYLLSLL